MASSIVQPACWQCRPPTAAAAARLRSRQPQPFCPAAPQERRRWQGAAAARRPGTLQVCAAAAVVDVETARKLLDGPAMIIDLRTEREYENDGRITKPPRKSVNCPFSAGQDTAAFVAQVSSRITNRNAQLIVMCRDGGPDSAAAAAALLAAGFPGAQQMEGGFAGYSAVWSPSGKRRPPAGRWVSTGKEALKSGLNIPGVAESYDEGGNLRTARYAEGLQPGQDLPN